MRVLITGSDGFIGSHLVAEYRKQNNLVFGWSLSGVYECGKHIRPLRLLAQEDVETALKDIMPDLIIHCAGCADVNFSMKNPVMDMESNYVTTHNILFAMKNLDMKYCRFILLSSAAVYGNPYSLPVSENQPVNPLSPYALHKRAAEEVCLFMNKNYEADTKIMRIFSAYGPGLKKQIFWDMYQKVQETGELSLFGSGFESRDYIYIDDLVQATLLIAKTDSATEIFNVANGIEVCIRDVAKVFADFMGISEDKICFTGTRREGDPINWRADISELKKTGYSRKVPFEMGVKKYVEWVSQGY